jgi:malate synthase
MTHALPAWASGGSLLGGPEGVRILGPVPPAYARVLSPEALELVARLQRRFGGSRRALLARRAEVQDRFDAGWRPSFADSKATRAVRERSWRVEPPPPDLRDRRVEITGPVDRKMIVNALNSGAQVFMADFEDALAPTWANVVEGQAHLADAVRGTIEHRDETTGRVYRLAERTATLVVRPRGWHLEERHVLVDGEPVSASLFDFALFLHHNAHALVARGSGPYVYLPKLESHLEARLWNEVFLAAQDELGLAHGTIRATVLIETLPAAFEMEEILFELRRHATGLNCGRWDYIFSFLKCFRADPALVLPDRELVGMDRRFLRSYSLHLIRTCHRRGAHALGGMAAQIPLRHDPLANARALAQVRDDKRREAGDGHDGTWVAHPGLIAVAREPFDAVLDGTGRTDQLHRLRADVHVRAEDLLAAPTGPITAAGLHRNLEVALRYLGAWLAGRGCVPIHGLMEDAATAEIARAQVWQWRRHRARLEDGGFVDDALVRAALAAELARLRASLAPDEPTNDRHELAAEILAELVLADELAPFLTLAAYPHLATPPSTS